jgi:hypothetical protein
VLKRSRVNSCSPQFFEEVAQQDAWRAQRCHELLSKLTGGGRGLDAS